MSFSTVLPIWQAVQQRFHKTAKALPEQDLDLQSGSSTIGSLLRHNAEVEFMFAEWYFGRSIPEEAKAALSRGKEGNDEPPLNKEELIALLEASNDNLIEAMRSLTDEAWQQRVESSFGASSPLEAVGRLMYHTGIHSGQISFIQKNGRSQ
ncbi:DinB family protein [Cohnella herbarum]|uniref:DinB family protein n=1 Tax=Cohnella herbarum TaxID=2728023 RepID=A0A7Z2VJU1_9BACL|nr:DinB family protein [Cohnella herbarum]QJD84508.1 DinB family protein [Cohnella herbarum]